MGRRIKNDLNSQKTTFHKDDFFANHEFVILTFFIPFVSCYSLFVLLCFLLCFSFCYVFLDKLLTFVLLCFLFVTHFHFVMLFCYVFLVCFSMFFICYLLHTLFSYFIFLFFVVLFFFCYCFFCYCFVTHFLLSVLRRFLMILTGSTPTNHLRKIRLKKNV